MAHGGYSSNRVDHKFRVYLKKYASRERKVSKTAGRKSAIDAVATSGFTICWIIADGSVMPHIHEARIPDGEWLTSQPLYVTP